MTESTDTRNRREVLRVYRQYRNNFMPAPAMNYVRDHFAHLSAYSVLCGAGDAARADAECFEAATGYLRDIHRRQYRTPYWQSGEFTPPIPPEVIDRCLICSDTHEDHNTHVRFHAFQSAL